MTVPLLAATVILTSLVSTVQAGEVCTVFPDTENQLTLTDQGKFYCFLVRVPEKAAMQVITPQPVDLVITLEGQGVKLQVDSFELGVETATLIASGEFRVHITGQDLAKLPHTLTVSRKLISLQKGFAWRNAENAATETKQIPALREIQYSRNLWSELSETHAVALTYLKEADYYHAKQDYKTARDTYDVAMRLCEELDDLRCQTEAANNSGLDSQQIGDFESSQGRLLSAVQGWKALKQPSLEAITLSNLGIMHSHAGEFQQALSFYSRAAEVLQPLNQVGFAVVENNLGLLYQSISEYGIAEKYFRRALQIERSHLKGRVPALRAGINLGRNMVLRGRPASGVTVLTEVIRQAEALDDRQAIATASINLAEAYLALHSVSQAKPFLERALGLHEILKDKRSLAADHHYLGVAAEQEGHVPEAKLQFAEASSIRIQSELKNDAIASLYELSRLELREGHLDTARELAEKAFSYSETVRVKLPGPELRASYMATRRKILDLLIQIDFRADKAEGKRKALLTAELGQGRALLDLLAENSLLASPPPELVEKQTALEHRLGMISDQLLRANDGRQRSLRSQAQIIVEQREGLEARIRDFQPERKLGQPLNDVDKLQRELLPPGTALLEYHLGDSESYLWLVTAKSLDVFRLPSKARIEKESTRFLSLFSRVNERKRSPELEAEFVKAIQNLSHSLLEPLAGKPLPETLMLVCDGILHRIPFEVLQPFHEKTPLGLSHHILRIPSAGYLTVGREVSAMASFPLKFAGIADPVFSQDLPRLPFTEEIDVIQQLIPAAKRTVLTGFQANRTNLLKLPLQDYAVLHFSTHAIMDDRVPALSRVALSLVNRKGKGIDGYMRPAQLAELQLSGSVVVLSACETALGKQVMGEGLAGLTAALFQAGAGQLVLTLSSVDAEGSAAFFAQVYRSFFGRHPVSMEAALCQARRTIAASKRWNDPYYWAPFIVVGRPTGRI